VAELVEAGLHASDPRLAGLRRIAIVPAFNEQESIARVIDEIRAFDAELEIVVVDDGSHDRTAAVAEQRGAHVVRLPFNLGIGGAVQTGFHYAFEHGFRLAVRIDGDGQHDASQLGLLLEPVLAGEADIAVGSRFAGPRGASGAPDRRPGADGLAGGASSPAGYQSSRPRRAGITILAYTVSLLVGRRVTDPTSGFQALNRHAIGLFAADYPHDIPEVEAVLMLHKHRLRMVEVPVSMRERAGGRSSIGAVFAIYYMVKVLLALFVGLFRKNVTPLEDTR
jgi:glycosyltransferase involved in cell wall biosynthesis